ncbi:MAG: phosphoribosylglycinamide formyltransferase [Pirellulaceae bacterium]|nr:phosphoribosylglycinamide formyltransferase [Planctomycetaceae bacterium]
MTQEKNPLSLAVLISGGGTTLENLLKSISQGQLDANVNLVISSRKDAAGLDYARNANILHHVVRRKKAQSAKEFSEANFQLCREATVDLVVMGGYLQHLLIPADFENRVTNIHPGLIPAFCGKGYYGRRVHEAVLGYGVKVSGCTVHFVDNQYDHGPIILQRTVNVLEGDSPESLAERIFQQECIAYPEAIQAIATGRLKVDGRRIRWQE